MQRRVVRFVTVEKVASVPAQVAFVYSREALKLVRTFDFDIVVNSKDC